MYLSTQLIGNLFTRLSWEQELTFETIPISLANQYPKLHSEVLIIYFLCMGEYRRENVKT